MKPTITNGASQTNGTPQTTPIDWQAVHQKMTLMQAATQQKTELAVEEKLALLKTRAHSLARPPAATEATGHQLEIAEFRLGEETYAFPSTSVREVYPLKGLTPLPCTPGFVLGVMNVRGRIIPIIDLASLLGLVKQQITEQSTVILIKSEDLEVGIVTNLGVSVRSLPLATISPPLSTFANSRARYLQGITNDGVVILDAAKLLNGVRLGTHEG